MSSACGLSWVGSWISRPPRCRGRSMRPPRRSRSPRRAPRTARADTGSGGVNCGPVQHYAGPDTAAGSLDGTCTDAVGNSASMSFPFAYDDTPPDVTATASRTPDVDSWYNAPLSVSFAGTDALSGG